MRRTAVTTALGLDRDVHSAKMPGCIAGGVVASIFYDGYMKPAKY